MSEEVGSWSSLSGGDLEIELEPGTYRFEGDLPLAVARVHRTSGGPVERMYPSGADLSVFVETQDPPPTEKFTPVAFQPLVVRTRALFRITRPKGILSLMKQ